MSVVIFLCSLFGIHIGESGSEEMISYNDTNTVVTVSLDENPSTGYGWTYTVSEDGVIWLANDEFHSEATGNIAGAGGVRAFSFSGLKAGTVEITFTYLRSWEGDPIRTVVIECSVAADRTVTAQLLSDLDAE